MLSEIFYKKLISNKPELIDLDLLLAPRHFRGYIYLEFKLDDLNLL